jgi:hypothetical protein
MTTKLARELLLSGGEIGISKGFLDPTRIEDDMFDTLPFPGVGDVNPIIIRLDDRRVGELSRLIFKIQDSLPQFAIAR